MIEHSGSDSKPLLSVIVPFHGNAAHLERCLTAIRVAQKAIDGQADLVELIVVADGETDDSSESVDRTGGRLVTLTSRSGPAVARNRGAAVSQGSVLVFIDSDVIVAPDALERIVEVFDRERDVAAVFGAYDDEPDGRTFVSRARDLSHTFVHRSGRTSASTFWAGIGAVRSEAFTSVGGFDERFGRPSVEDIDLGYRLRAAGHRIVLAAKISGRHLKVWSIGSSVHTDLCCRGIPWTQLLHRYGSMQNDLNLSHRYRACTTVSWAAFFFGVGALWRPSFIWAALACLLALVGLEWRYYAFFSRRGGLVFAARWDPLHVFHHFSNAIAFAVGTILFVLAQMTGFGWPGALPVDPWPIRSSSRGWWPHEDQSIEHVERDGLLFPD